MGQGTSFRGTPTLQSRGLPGRVWSLLAWFIAASAVIALSLAAPMNPGSSPTLRIVALLSALVSIAVLATLGAGTPVWLLHAFLVLSLGLALVITYASVTPVGTVTSSLGLIGLAAYIGFWVTSPASLAYGAGIVVGLFIAYGAGGDLPELLVPCALVSALSLGLLLTFSILVRQLDQQVMTDPLTGLLNRAGLSVLTALHSGSGRVMQPRCLVVIDLDRLKVINDEEGHLAGDRVLAEFGRSLGAVIRPDDTAVRVGGDEFVVILPRTDLSGAEAFAARLRNATPIAWSHGVTEWPAGEDLDAALARADRRMYAEKDRRSGRAGFSS